MVTTKKRKTKKKARPNVQGLEISEELLRDAFAGLALLGMCANTEYADMSTKETASVAYDLADQMLDQRDVEPDLDDEEEEDEDDEELDED